MHHEVSITLCDRVAVERLFGCRLRCHTRSPSAENAQDDWQEIRNAVSHEKQSIAQEIEQLFVERRPVSNAAGIAVARCCNGSVVGRHSQHGFDRAIDLQLIPCIGRLGALAGSGWLLRLLLLLSFCREAEPLVSSLLDQARDTTKNERFGWLELGAAMLERLVQRMMPMLSLVVWIHALERIVVVILLRCQCVVVVFKILATMALLISCCCACCCCISIVVFVSQHRIR